MSVKFVKMEDLQGNLFFCNLNNIVKICPQYEGLMVHLIDGDTMTVKHSFWDVLVDYVQLTSDS